MRGERRTRVLAVAGLLVGLATIAALAFGAGLGPLGSRGTDSSGPVEFRMTTNPSPIFRLERLAVDDRASGTMRIENTGAVRGVFRLSGRMAAAADARVESLLDGLWVEIRRDRDVAGAAIFKGTLEQLNSRDVALGKLDPARRGKGAQQPTTATLFFHMRVRGGALPDDNTLEDVGPTSQTFTVTAEKESGK